jgi:hypothetical protein
MVAGGTAVTDVNEKDDTFWNNLFK